MPKIYLMPYFTPENKMTGTNPNYCIRHIRCILDDGICLKMLQNSEGKGKQTGYQDFLISHKVFKKPLLHNHENKQLFDKKAQIFQPMGKKVTGIKRPKRILSV